MQSGYAATAREVRTRRAAAATAGEVYKTVLNGTRVHIVARPGGHKVSSRNPAMKEMLARLIRALGGKVTLLV